MKMKIPSAGALKRDHHIWVELPPRGPCRKGTPFSHHGSPCQGRGEISMARLRARLPWVCGPRAISPEGGLLASRNAAAGQEGPKWPEPPGLQGLLQEPKDRNNPGLCCKQPATEMELISGKPSMRQGPAHRDLPFGQMSFPETCQLLCVAAVAPAAERQRQPGLLQPPGLTSNTDFLEQLFLLETLIQKESLASSGERRRPGQPSG